MSIIPVSTQHALAVLVDTPVPPHRQATSENLLMCDRIGGERMLTSAKCLNECEPVQIAELTCPKRHTGV